MARENNRNNRINRQAAAARDRAEEVMSEGADRARDYAEEMGDRASAVWEKTKRQARQGASRVQEYAEDNPWQIAGIAAAAGFLLGMLIMRNRD